jgi:hypothetical protein
LPAPDEDAVSLYVDPELPIEERLLLYILLLNGIVQDAMNYQRQHLKDPEPMYYLIVLDEFWQILAPLKSDTTFKQNTTTDFLLDTLARNTRKYRIAVIYASQAREDIFGQENSAMRASITMKFYGAGEEAPEDTLLNTEIISPEFRGLYNNVIIKSKSSKKDKLFLMDTPRIKAIVSVTPSEHEKNYAEVIRQGDIE